MDDCFEYFANVLLKALQSLRGSQDDPRTIQCFLPLGGAALPAAVDVMHTKMRGNEDLTAFFDHIRNMAVPPMDIKLDVHNGIEESHNYRIEETLMDKDISAVPQEDRTAQQKHAVWDTPVQPAIATTVANESGGQYTVTIEKRPGAKLGLDVETTAEAGCLIIRDITRGLVSDWNQSHPDLRIKAGHKIIEVNGFRGDAPSLVEKCAHEKTLHMVLQIPCTSQAPLLTLEEKVGGTDAQHYAVTLVKDGGQLLGLAVDVETEKDCLVISGVTGGLAGEWNTCHQDCQIKVGHKIVEVNGCRGDAASLVGLCKREEKLHMVLQIPCTQQAPLLILEEDVGSTGDSEYTVTFVRDSGQRLGLALDTMAENDCLLVDDVSGGLAAEWNAGHQDCQITVGHKIVEVNGFRGDANSLVERCGHGKTLQIVFQKPQI
jgi:uncharacterized Zn-binding protein involved in type VI secretion